MSKILQKSIETSCVPALYLRLTKTFRIKNTDLNKYCKMSISVTKCH